MTQLDIWRSADALMKQYGKGAVFIAALRADELLARGDREGCSVWARITLAIDTLLREKPHEREVVH